MVDVEEGARRIKAARLAVGLTQEQAAEKLGMKRPSYAQYEIGRRSPSWLVMFEMVEVLGLDPAILFPEFVPPKEVSGPVKPPKAARPAKKPGKKGAK